MAIDFIWGKQMKAIYKTGTCLVEGEPPLEVGKYSGEIVNNKKKCQVEKLWKIKKNN